MNKVKYLSVLVLLMVVNQVSAQLSIDAMNTTYTEDFTGYAGDGFAPNPTAGQLDSDTWRVTGLQEESGTPMVFGDVKTTGDYARGTWVSGNQGGLYNFDTGSNETQGFQLAGNDMTPGEVTYKIFNNTGQTIQELEIDYIIYTLNDGERSNFLNFAHSANDVGYTNQPTIDFSSPEAEDASPTWVATPKAITLTGLNILNGSNYYLQWQMGENSGSGTRDKLALDNVSVKAVPQLEVNFASTTYSENEGGGTVDLTLTISEAPTSDVTVDVNVFGGTATNPADFTYTPAQVTFPNGDASDQVVTVTIVDDNLVEGDETVDFELANPTGGASLGATKNTELTIEDNDQSNVVFSAATQQVSEGVGSATITVNLDKANANSDVTVDVALVGGSATEGADFDYATTQTVTFTAGDNTPQVVTVPITDDAIVEGDETALFDLTNPVNATVGTPSQHEITITDNDRSVMFALANDQVGEAAGSIDIAVSIVGADPANPTSVDVALKVGGTATEGNDFNYATTQTVTFPAGDGNDQIVTIPINEDTEVEALEYFDLELINPTNGASVGAPDDMRVEIIDNDQPVVRFVGTGQQVNENGTNISLQVELDQIDPDDDVTVDVIVSSGTATASTDYSFASPVTMTFLAGSSPTQSILIPIINDNLPENDEDFVLELTNATNATIGSPSQYTVDIINDDFEFSLLSDFISVNEGVGTVDVAVKLDGESSASDMTVDLVLLGGGSATTGSDYTFSSPTKVTFPASDNVDKVVSIPINDDTEVEQTEHFTLQLQNPSGNALILIPDTFRVEIENNDIPELSFGDATQSINEDAGTVTVTVTLNVADPFNDTEVDVVLTGGTATNGTDYNYTFPEHIVYPAGTSGIKTLHIPITDDFDVEGNEDFVLELQNETSNVIVTPNQTDVVTIIDNDFDPQVYFTSVGQDVIEDVNNVTLSVGILNPRPTATTVDVVLNVGASSAAEGSDFNYAVTQQVTFPPNDNAVQDVTFQIIDDTDVEPNETIVFDLANVNNNGVYGAQTHTVTIYDNDLPAIQFGEATASVNEGDGVLTITTEITEASNCSASYTVVDESATNNTDMIVTAGVPVVFVGMIGVDQPDIIIPIVDDLDVEGDETFLLVLDAINPLGIDVDECRIGINDTLRVTIVDNEDVPVIEWDLSQINTTEGDGTVIAHANATEAADCKITVKVSDVSSTYPDDYTLTVDTLFFVANTDTTIEINIVDDNLFEGVQEEAWLILGRTVGACSIGANDSLLVTIDDNDDAPELNWAQTVLEVDEINNTIGLEVLTSQNSASCHTTVVLSGGTATTDDDYTFADPTEVYFTVGGATSKYVDLSIIDDVILEGAETVRLELIEDVADACTVGTNNVITVIIKRNDVPVYPIDDIDDETIDGMADSLGVTLAIKATIQDEITFLGTKAFWVNDGTGAMVVVDNANILTAATIGDSLLFDGVVDQITGTTVLSTEFAHNLGTKAIKSGESVVAINEPEESYKVTYTCLNLNETTSLTSPIIKLTDANNDTVNVWLDFTGWENTTIEEGAYSVEGFVWQDDDTSPFTENYVLVAKALTQVDLQVSSTFDFSVVGRQVSFSYTGSGALNFAWDFGDSTSESIKNPITTYAADGTYQVVLTADNGICSYPNIDTVIVNTVSILENTTDVERIVVYPNPVKNGRIIISGLNSNGLLNVIALDGSLVVSQELNTGKTVVELPETSGVYLVVVYNGSNTILVRERIIVE